MPLDTGNKFRAPLHTLVPLMVVCVSGLLALLTPSQQTDTDMDPSHHSAGAAVDSATAQHSSPREEEEEFTEETFDYILELPQLDLYTDIDFDRFPVSVLVSWQPRWELIPPCTTICRDCYAAPRRIAQARRVDV